MVKNKRISIDDQLRKILAELKQKNSELEKDIQGFSTSKKGKIDQDIKTIEKKIRAYKNGVQKKGEKVLSNAHAPFLEAKSFFEELEQQYKYSAGKGFVGQTNRVQTEGERVSNDCREENIRLINEFEELDPVMKGQMIRAVATDNVSRQRMLGNLPASLSQLASFVASPFTSCICSGSALPLFRTAPKSKDRYSRHQETLLKMDLDETEEDVDLDEVVHGIVNSR